MSMPYVDDDLDEEVTAENLEGFENEGSDLALDMSGGDIVINDGDAETIDGEEALMQWIEKVFHTRAYVYDIYDTGDENASEEEDEYDDEGDVIYGSESLEILMDPDMPRELKLANIQQDIEDTLSLHPDILSISDFEFNQNKRNLTVTFSIQSVYGEHTQEVIISGEDSE